MWRTTLVTISTCFLLGTTFTHWIADHNVLWRTPLTAEAVDVSIAYYSIVSEGPSWLSGVYLSVVAVALLSSGGRLWKVWQGQQGEMLFDGASVVLLLSLVYTQIAEVLPSESQP